MADNNEQQKSNKSGDAQQDIQRKDAGGEREQQSGSQEQRSDEGRRNS